MCIRDRVLGEANLRQVQAELVLPAAQGELCPGGRGSLWPSGGRSLAPASAGTRQPMGSAWRRGT
eukprot:85831-Alexandrium_andersonii.AAC.1